MLVSDRDDHLLAATAMYEDSDLAVCQYIALTHYTDGSMTRVLGLGTLTNVFASRLFFTYFSLDSYTLQIRLNRI